MPSFFVETYFFLTFIENPADVTDIVSLQFRAFRTGRRR